MERNAPKTIWWHAIFSYHFCRLGLTGSVMSAEARPVEDRICLEDIKRSHRGWRNGSVVKSIDCSLGGPEFKSQQPHGGSQPSIMRSMPSSAVSEDSYSVLTYNKYNL